MFIFYYAVLSEVSPPTALAAVAAAAITGGKVIPTMWQACEVHAAGVPRPARLRDHRQRLAAARCRATSSRSSGPPRCRMVAVAALAAVTGGWIVRARPARPERLLCVPAAVLLLYLEPLSIAIGARLSSPPPSVAHLLTRRQSADASHPQRVSPVMNDAVIRRIPTSSPRVAAIVPRPSSLAALRRPATGGAGGAGGTDGRGVLRRRTGGGRSPSPPATPPVSTTWSAAGWPA